ncbi:hypothetical protein Cadr_000026250 [Camelus dromedarius]|uniref:Uncharacterized protein n=1 Tax=Camelus dromedarius TaxID=9838 RepID=A0A5N4CE31_CAMDR|nr:hypothetical protein Cadr_000026250 [Camelus dromedarius]
MDCNSDDSLWDLQFGFGIDHLVDLIPDEPLAAYLFLSPLVLNLNNMDLLNKDQQSLLSTLVDFSPATITLVIAVK